MPAPGGAVLARQVIVPSEDIVDTAGATLRTNAGEGDGLRSYAESGLRGPAATTIRGAFAPDGRSVAVSLRQVITYPPNTKGCALQTIVAHGTFALASGG